VTETVVEADLAETVVEADLAVEATEAEDSEEILVRNKCTRQFAQNVSKNVKFLSSQQKADQFTVRNALLNKETKQ
jgi:hypothetical protein